MGRRAADLTTPVPVLGVPAFVGGWKAASADRKKEALLQTLGLNCSIGVQTSPAINKPTTLLPETLFSSADDQASKSYVAKETEYKEILATKEKRTALKVKSGELKTKKEVTFKTVGGENCHRNIKETFPNVFTGNISNFRTKPTGRFSNGSVVDSDMMGGISVLSEEPSGGNRKGGSSREQSGKALVYTALSVQENICGNCGGSQSLSSKCSTQIRNQSNQHQLRDGLKLDNIHLQCRKMPFQAYPLHPIDGPSPAGNTGAKTVTIATIETRNDRKPPYRPPGFRLVTPLMATATKSNIPSLSRPKIKVHQTTIDTANSYEAQESKPLMQEPGRVVENGSMFSHSLPALDRTNEPSRAPQSQTIGKTSTCNSGANSQSNHRPNSGIKHCFKSASLDMPVSENHQTNSQVGMSTSEELVSAAAFGNTLCKKKALRNSSNQVKSSSASSSLSTLREHHNNSGWRASLQTDATPKHDKLAGHYETLHTAEEVAANDANEPGFRRPDQGSIAVGKRDPESGNSLQSGNNQTADASASEARSVPDEDRMLNQRTPSVLRRENPNPSHVADYPKSNSAIKSGSARPQCRMNTRESSSTGHKEYEEHPVQSFAGSRSEVTGVSTTRGNVQSNLDKRSYESIDAGETQTSYKPIISDVVHQSVASLRAATRYRELCAICFEDVGDETPADRRAVITPKLSAPKPGDSCTAHSHPAGAAFLLPPSPQCRQSANLRERLESVEASLVANKDRIRTLLNIIYDLEACHSPSAGGRRKTASDLKNCSTCQKTACAIYSVEYDFRQQEKYFTEVLNHPGNDASSHHHRRLSQSQHLRWIKSVARNLKRSKAKSKKLCKTLCKRLARRIDQV